MEYGYFGLWPREAYAIIEDGLMQSKENEKLLREFGFHLFIQSWSLNHA
jgi:hypothetical protein